MATFTDIANAILKDTPLEARGFRRDSHSIGIPGSVIVPGIGVGLNALLKDNNVYVMADVVFGKACVIASYPLSYRKLLEIYDVTGKYPKVDGNEFVLDVEELVANGISI